MKQQLILTAALALLLAACGGKDNDSKPGTTNPEPGGNTPTTETTAFTQGADISWVTEMEANGQKFYNADGQETDCFRLMQELGMDAIRLRVWVDPKDGWSGKQDVVAKARRAHALGMDLMIDFHYSDSWADPGQQFKPAAWQGLSADELKTAIRNHTTDVLQALKAEGIEPRWVQVGNEIRPGMLWDEDAARSGAMYDIRECDVKGLNSTSTAVKYRKNVNNLAAFVNAGYDAVKEVFPQAIVIVHLDNAWDDQTWWFDQFKAAGGKLDMIGLSHYPQTHATKTWQEMNSLALQHVGDLAGKYGVKVMVAEVGVKRGNADSPQVLSEFISKAKAIEQCAGVWYWEPECHDWNGYDMGAFDATGKPTAVMDAFRK